MAPFIIFKIIFNSRNTNPKPNPNPNPIPNPKPKPNQGRIQEFILGPNQGPQSKVKGEARIKGAKRPSIEGEARIEGAKRPSIEGEARELRAKPEKKRGRRVWGGGLVSPSPENFWKIKLETIHFGEYLKQLFEMTNEMV